MSTMKSSLLAARRTARPSRSRMTRTEQRPASFGSAIEPAVQYVPFVPRCVAEQVPTGRDVLQFVERSWGEPCRFVTGSSTEQKEIQVRLLARQRRCSSTVEPLFTQSGPARQPGRLVPAVGQGLLNLCISQCQRSVEIAGIANAFSQALMVAEMSRLGNLDVLYDDSRPSCTRQR